MAGHGYRGKTSTCSSFSIFSSHELFSLEAVGLVEFEIKCQKAASQPSIQISIQLNWFMSYMHCVLLISAA